MNYIICKTFQGQDEVLVHKQLTVGPRDREKGREGGREGGRRGGRE